MELTMLDASPETMSKLIHESTRSLITSTASHRVTVSDDAPGVAPEEVVGAFMIFCGGLVMAIDEAMPIAAEQLSAAVGHQNTMGICCFGEQGVGASQKEACHGNLMFGCLVFSNKPRVLRRKSLLRESSSIDLSYPSVHGSYGLLPRVDNEVT